MGALSILVVEDIPLVAKGIETSLRTFGYGLAGCARDGESAVEMALRLKPDLILMDVQLGAGMNGVEAAAMIQQSMDVPIVYLTAYSDDDTLRAAKETDLYGYVVKPYEDSNLKTAIEIAHHKHAVAKRLKESERWLAATLSSIGDGVIAVNEGGKVRFMNPLAESLTGWRQADATGQPIEVVLKLCSESRPESIRNPVRQALECGETVAVGAEVELEDRHGVRRPVDDVAAPIKGKNNEINGAVTVFRDVSQRRDLELRLHQAQKMEALGRLAGGVAHDLNNLMTSIMGFSELILNTPYVPAGALESAFTIHASVQKAAEITRQITTFSRKQPVQMKTLDLNLLLRENNTLLQAMLGNVRLEMELQEPLGAIRADSGQLNQVLLNLTANARDATPDGGVLRVTTRLTERREVHLSFADSGCGMSLEIQKSLFEPYFTTKEVGKGSGLGLATVYGVVQQFGGRIEVESKLGRGSAFHIYLPLADSPEPKPVQTKSETTILLVEHDDSVRRMLSQLLHRQGYNVLPAATGQEALQQMHSRPGAVDLVLADLALPQMGGRQLASRLDQDFGMRKVLLMSGLEPEPHRAGLPVLNKPFTVPQLTRLLKQMLGHSDLL